MSRTTRTQKTPKKSRSIPQPKRAKNGAGRSVPQSAPVPKK